MTHRRPTTPTTLIYAPESRVQRHVCASGKIADALERYIRHKHHEQCAARISDATVRLDPGGMTFERPTQYEFTALPYHVTICAEHVGVTCAMLRDRSLHSRQLLDDVDIVRIQMFHHALALPAEDVPVILEWLVSKASEAAAETELRLQGLRNDPRIALPPGPTVGRT